MTLGATDQLTLVSLFHWSETLRMQGRLEESAIKHLYVLYVRENKFARRHYDLQESYKKTAFVLKEFSDRAATTEEGGNPGPRAAEKAMAEHLEHVSRQKGDEDYNYISDFKSESLKHEKDLDTPLQRQKSTSRPFLYPEGFDQKVIEKVVAGAVRWNRNEKGLTGALIIIGKNAGTHKPPSDGIPYKFMNSEQHEALMKCQVQCNSEQGLNFCIPKCKDTFNKQVFTQDGAVIVEPKSGKVTAMFCKLYPELSKCHYVHENKGTRHNTALEMTMTTPCVAVTRSDEGGVTLYSSDMSEKGYCLHLPEL